MFGFGDLLSLCNFIHEQCTWISAVVYIMVCRWAELCCCVPVYWKVLIQRSAFVLLFFWQWPWPGCSFDAQKVTLESLRLEMITEVGEIPSKRFVALCHWKETNKHKDWTILLRVILICVRTKAASHGHRKWKTGDILLSDGCFVASGERNNLWFEGRAAMFHHARLPARYFLLCCFLIISLWLFFNFMSFMYVAGERKHTLPGTARHLQGNSLVADFSLNSDEQDISLLGLIRTDEDKRVRELGYSRYAFNELISNRLGFHRSVKDTRHKL